MDKINFLVGETCDLEGVQFKSYDVTVHLNDVKMPHNIFNASAVLPVSVYHQVEFDLFTCSCGVAGCAGFQSYIVQSAKDGIVTWTFPKSDDYVTDKKVYQFEEIEFKETFTRLIEQMLDLEKQGIYHNTLIRDESMYGYDDEESTNVSYEVTETLKNSMDWFDNRYHGTQNFQEMLKKSFPEMLEKTFKYSYDGVEGKTKYALGDIVCNLLNQYPAKAKEVAFLKKAKLAAQAIVGFMAGERIAFQKFSHDSYEKHNMSSNSLIHWDFHEIKEEEFDFEKINLFTL